MSSFLPDRPGSIAVEGVLRGEDGGRLAITGRLQLPDDNQVRLEGELTSQAGSGAFPMFARFAGRTASGATASVEHAQFTGSLTGGPVVVIPNSPVEVAAVRAPEQSTVTSAIKVTWTLAHSALLWRAARRNFVWSSDRLRAAGLAFGAIAARSADRESACRWEVDGATFEVVFQEESQAQAAHPLHFEVQGSRFVSRLTAKVPPEARSGTGLLARIAALNRTAERLLHLAGFMGGGHVVWYQRVEEAFVPVEVGPVREFHHRVAHLNPGDAPAPGDSWRAMGLSDTFARHTPAAIERLSLGEPFVSAAIDTYLLARNTRDWPGKLILFSTALESMKALWLRSQPHEGILSDAQFAGASNAVKTALKAHLTGAGVGPEVREQMYAKLRDLNRPSYASALRGMIAHWAVPMAGLTDPLAFVKTRDCLIHTGAVPNGDSQELVQQTEALERLVERVIGTWLGLPERALRAMND